VPAAGGLPWDFKDGTFAAHVVAAAVIAAVMMDAGMCKTIFPRMVAVLVEMHKARHDA
jgi:hypothetical protein